MRVAGAAAQGDADRRRGRAVRRERVGVRRQRTRASRTPRRAGPPPSASSPTRRRSRPVPSQPGAEESRQPTRFAARRARASTSGRRSMAAPSTASTSRCPACCYAAVEIAPVYGGKLVSVDTAPAEAMPGVKRVVRLEEAVAVVADSYWRARTALAALKPQFDDAGHGDVSSATIFDAFDKALGAPPEMPANRGHGRHRRLSRAVSRARDDGADGVHGAGGRRPRRGLGGHAGSAQRALDRGQGARTSSRAGAVHEPGARRRLRTATAGQPRLRRHGGAHREGDVAGAGEADLEPRERHPARLLPAGRHGALCRRARRGRRAAGRASYYAGGGDGESTFMPYAIAEKNAEARDAKHPIRTGRSGGRC